jgi:predicted RNA-binding Zn ribbon-like protein
MPTTSKQPATPQTLPLWGGALCLDFANSVDWSAEDTELEPWTDALRTPQDLARWGRRLGVLCARATPGEDELACARELRAALHRLFSATAREEAPAKADLELLTAHHAEATAAGTLTATEEGTVGLRWPATDPRRIRFAIAVDAVTLLGDRARLDRVHRCPGRACGWLFLDTSGRRRWCSMSTCGSRAKMRRLYARQREQAR